MTYASCSRVWRSSTRPTTNLLKFLLIGRYDYKETAVGSTHAMLQMRQSMPNNIPSLRKYQVHPIDLSQMWVDCYPSEDTNEGETMNCDWCGNDFDTDDRGVLTIHEKAP